METGLDTGTYEVLHDRLAAQAAELARRAEALNARRAEEFGSMRLELTGTERLRTGHHCVPRDIVSVGERLLFGHNVFLGLKPETTVGDVFALHDRDLNRLPDAAVPGLLDDPAFVREFAALHRYYRQAHLLQLRCLDGKLLAVFQTGEKAGDIRVLRWALSDDGRAAFLDARGDRDHVFPPSHDFEWTETTREHHVLGRHPHVSVEGEVFVQTVGGTLTVKVEDNTETAEGIYTEPVDEPLQSLADADIAYARVGPLILLRIRPYKEDTHRYLVFNTLARTVVRLDGIGQACRRLPGDQGIVFPGGYCLATGTHKTFDGIDTADLEFERVVRSPNGEDVLFAFHARVEGRSLLLPYNMIRKEVSTPLICHGWALFEDGALVVLRADSDEPQRVHPVQLWNSPYVSDHHAAARPVGTGPLARVGNADLVRGISDCLSITRAVAETTPTGEVYAALAAACVRAADSYHWLSEPELGDLRTPLDQVRTTAEQVLAEFETVQTLTRQAAEALTGAAARIAGIVRRLRGEAPREAAAWIQGLTELRHAQGHLLTLKDLRYADITRIDELAADVEADVASFGRRAVAHLAREDAFASHHADVEQLVTDAEAIATVAEAAPVTTRLDELAAGLRTVTEVVGGLDIADATVRTSILERIAEVLGGVNRARATLDGRRRALLDREGRREFAAEFALLGQAVTGALATADSPEACDEQLAHLLVQVESLESRFTEFDDFLGELADRRDEIHEAFSARKQTLTDARARRAERLADSATRVLRTVARRTAMLADADAVATYFTSDPMPAKVRRTADELRHLGDQVRAEELDGRVKAARQEALLALRDRTDLYTDDGRTLRLGTHRFAVNTQPLDLTLVPHGDNGLAFALTGTDYRCPVTDPDFAATRPYWDRPLPSESPEVYRAEHLAARLLDEHDPAALTRADLDTLVRQAAEAAYDEGYERGVHDHDTVLILAALLRLHEGAGLRRHEPAARAAAQLFWAHGTTPEARESWTRRAVSLARARDTFGLGAAITDLQQELADAITASGATGDAAAAGAYLFEELTSGPDGFVISSGTRTLLDKFRRTVGTSAYDDDLAALGHLSARKQLVEAWLSSYAASTGTDITQGDLAEAVTAELCSELTRYDSEAPLTETVEGLLGTHPRITGGRLVIRIDELLARTRHFRTTDVPGHRTHQRQRTALVTAARTRIHLDDYQPRVMSAFVRNRLIDEVYLPLIGDSLAKQLGTTGDSKRTDTGGLLLLLSPPGYGKTTLMEYVAARLGLILVKVNGPALGHAVTSLDPAEASNATARQEIEKINFALETGNNTLLHLDDIQHTSPELLQKFIPLCDATRRIEGVQNGAPRTYDLRGKRFAVCMAGNPYTESGTRFRVPDMLANRADVWNLGDVLTGKQDVFALSFIENALTANPVLAGRDRADLGLLLRLAEGDSTARADRLTQPYAPAELERILSVLRHLLAARETVLAVNAAYIASAAQTDATRTEPPFQLQGSYRNMNKIAQRIQPVMNDAERDAVIDDHYTAEAQTLTTGAESNLLKLAELRGTLTAEQSGRWAEIRATYVCGQALGGPGDDQLVRAVSALGLLADRIAAVESAIDRATDPRKLLAHPHARHAAGRQEE
ncbi:DNA repair ATPase [Streptomyces sp. NBC_01236]|uniref:DNA repair ATPase n=1 Tax=Streptomyces sp. NBC_01236 TaxID=2903789 RepID=UPI002E15F1EB|nr:DNA repair ATPase [Streptomyces sp. NBC_01236]